MRDSNLGSLISAGKVFFPAEMADFSQKEGLTPALFTPGKSGVLLIGLGSTGADVLRFFFNRLPLYQYDGGPVIRAVSITSKNDFDLDGFERYVEFFSIGNVDNAERSRIDTDQRRNILQNINKYLNDQVSDLKNNFQTGSDIRCYLFGSLSEHEIGLLYPLLDILAKNRLSLVTRSLFLLFNSAAIPALDDQHHFSAIREIFHYLQTGTHLETNSAADKLLDRLYCFEGSKNGSDYSKNVFAVAETVLPLVFAARKIERVQSVFESDHSVRAIGFRSLAVPVLELRKYFATRFAREMWTTGWTLLPATEPTNEDVNMRYRAFHNDRAYSQYLSNWLGNDFADWLLNPGKIPPVVNESELSSRFVQKIVDFLSDLNLVDRYLIAWAGIWFVEGRTVGFPTIRDTCVQLRGGLEILFKSVENYRKFLDEAMQADRQLVQQAVTGSISRWNIRNFDERLERFYDLLLDSSQQARLIKYVARWSGVSAKYGNPVVFSPIFIPDSTQRRNIEISEYIWHDHQEYLDHLRSVIAEFLTIMLLESSETIDGIESDTTGKSFSFLREIQKPFADLEERALGKNAQVFLFADGNLNIDAIRRQFTFASSFEHVQHANNKIVTAMSVFTELEMNDFKHIKKCSENYTPDENTHIDDHLKTAAYFEKHLRKLNSWRAREPFSQQLIMLLPDRNTPSAFFKAFLSGVLKWHSRDFSWKIEAFDGYIEAELGLLQNSGLSQPIQKEGIHSLRDAYRLFAVDMTYSRLKDGDFHHPLHVSQRANYMKKLISRCKLDASEEQSARRKWLESQAEERRQDIELYDFYRLFQAVMRVQ